MTSFWIDDGRGLSLSHKELLAKLNERTSRRPVVRSADPVEIFVEVLLAVLQAQPLTILDPDCSDEVLTQLSLRDDLRSPIDRPPLRDAQELATRVRDADPDWQLTLLTSGTTGAPTRVSLPYRHLVRNVRTGPHHVGDVWAFAYNCTHIGGLQVFFQAMMNLNPMVNVFDTDLDTLESSLSRHRVTHISATPTFYRLRLRRLAGPHETVRRLVSGGERFDEALRASLRATFPSAQFRNIYALTEAGSLLQSEGELFSIPTALQGLVKLTEDDELIVHRSLVGETSSATLRGDWLYTGDLVERVGSDQFRLVGRASDFVNVAGNRVDLHEVEAILRGVKGVAEAVVTPRKSSVVGNLLVASVQPVEGEDPEQVEREVRQTIENLAPWKQPRIVKMESQIARNRAGKVQR